MKIIKASNGSDILVDDEDFEELSKRSWFIFQGFPATSITIEKGKRKRLIMHNVLCPPPKGSGLIVDHKNGNKLDHQKDNLVLITRAEKSYQAKPKGGGFKGVSKSGDGWRAMISKEGKKKHIGYFPEEELAAIAYDILAVLEFGKQAFTNFKLGSRKETSRVVRKLLEWERITEAELSKIGLSVEPETPPNLDRLVDLADRLNE